MKLLQLPGPVQQSADTPDDRSTSFQEHFPARASASPPGVSDSPSLDQGYHLRLFLFDAALDRRVACPSSAVELGVGQALDLRTLHCLVGVPVLLRQVVDDYR
jgi:hypothetical protein